MVPADEPFRNWTVVSNEAFRRPKNVTCWRTYVGFKWSSLFKECMICLHLTGFVFSVVIDSTLHSSLLVAAFS